MKAVIYQRFLRNKYEAYPIVITVCDAETGEILLQYSQLYSGVLEFVIERSLRDAIKEARKIGATCFKFDTNLKGVLNERFHSISTSFRE